MRVGSCSRVISRQAMSAIASRGPDTSHAYLVMGASEWGDWTPGSLPSRGWRGNGWGRTVGEIMSAYI
jgi:hypothetical protein